jgi:phosphatidylinositol alpha-mannosyltransferase
VVRIARGPASDPEAEATFASRLRRHLLTKRFDVVHSLGPLDAVASLNARRAHRRRRTVYTNLGNPLREWWETLPTNDAHERVVREIDVYGCLSEYGLRRLLSDYGRRGALTPGGVRLETFQPVASKEDVPTLLYSGALDVEGKGLKYLVSAMDHLARAEQRVRLWLSGSGDPAAVLAGASAATRERIEVLRLGRLEDQPARYSAAWVTVLPSAHEAFGLVLVESLACGTPIVGCNHASIPELVRPEIGALAEPYDSRALAEACGAALALAANPATADRCREAARQYDWDTAVAPAVERLYRAAG